MAAGGGELAYCSPPTSCLPVYLSTELEPVYTSQAGSDESGEGTQDKPYETILRVSQCILLVGCPVCAVLDTREGGVYGDQFIQLMPIPQAMEFIGGEPSRAVMVDSKVEGEVTDVTN